MSSMVDLRPEDQIVIRCEQCDYKCRYNIQLKNHISNNHIDKDVIPEIVGAQTSTMSEDLLNNKVNNEDAFMEITVALKKLKEDNDEKCKLLSNTIVKLVNKVTRIEKALFCNKKKEHVHSKENKKAKKNVLSENVNIQKSKSDQEIHGT